MSMIHHCNYHCLVVMTVFVIVVVFVFFRPNITVIVDWA